jgi:hypothetical protein
MRCTTQKERFYLCVRRITTVSTASQNLTSNQKHELWPMLMAYILMLNIEKQDAEV